MSRVSELRNIWQRIRADRNRVFIRSPLGSVSYGRTADLVTRFCAAFDQNSITQGSRILIVSANEPVASAAFLAAMLDGLVPVMLSPDSQVDRVNAIRQSVEPALLIADEVFAAGLDTSGLAVELNGVPVISISTAVRIELQSGLNVGWRDILKFFRSDEAGIGFDLPDDGREPRLPIVDDTTAYILFTSGTTKLPSGVQISRNALIAQLETLNRLFGYNVESRIFNATPLAHTDGLVQGLLLAAANGAALLRPGPFSLSNLEEWLDRIGRYRATHFVTNPTVLSLIDRFAAHDDYFDDDGFFGILSSASILRPSLWEKFESRFKCFIYNMYGMTETVANATYAGRHPEMGPVGTIGFPVDCQARLMAVSATGCENESTVEGELQIRGENIFQGYWKDPVRTAHTLLSDGWMRTGDLARRRDDGGLDIVGRISTVINMGGQSIVPEEIDEVLASHPAVLDVATVGVSDPEFEEVAVSAIVLEVPASESELTEHCRQHLERLKIPKRIIAVEKIPRGGAGKPNTAELRNLLIPLLAGGADSPVAGEDVKVTANAVYQMAADVFRIPAEDLEAGSSPATVEVWDSFNQLSLMIEAERRFGVRIPASQVAGIRTLGDLHQVIIGKQ